MRTIIFKPEGCLLIPYNLKGIKLIHIRNVDTNNIKEIATAFYLQFQTMFEDVYLNGATQN